MYGFGKSWGEGAPTAVLTTTGNGLVLMMLD